MFSLIITIISIALVTALALATIYYGGNAFRQGGDAAKAAQLINEGQQLSGAAAIAGANNVTVDAIADLTTPNAEGDVYLASAPAGWADAATGGVFTQAGLTAEVCAKVNEKAGITANPVAIGDITNYGCTTADTTMHFRF
jgi:hypothetical protein